MRLLRRRRGPSNLTCHEFVETITDYLEGTLPADRRASLDAHLAGCPGCSAYLDQMREVLRLTGMLREDQIPADARTDLLAVFHRWHSSA